MHNIGFIGLGKLGLECAEAMANDNIQVFGYDIEQRNSDKITVVDDIIDAVQKKEFVFIAVQTPHEKNYDGKFPTSHLPNKDFDYSYVIDVLKKISSLITKDQTVVLISTVLPGTCREHFLPILAETGCTFIYNPYLIAMGTTTWDMLNPEMVIIGTDNKQKANELRKFYNKILQKKDVRFEIGSYDDAESIKIFYNTFISAKIGLVNMIQDVAVKNKNIDPDFVSAAIGNSTQRIMSMMYMKPGMGDGGPCHPRDNIALRYLAEKLDLGYDLFGSIMTARERQAYNMAFEISKFNLPLIILGKSYKNNVDFDDGSSSILVGHYFNEISKQQLFFDDEPDNDGPRIYLLAHMNKFNDYNFFENSIVFDPWRSFSTNRYDIKVIHYGTQKL